MRRILLVAALAILGARGIHAQAFATNDPVLRRLWTLGMDSSLAYPLMQTLLDSIGPRLTGTPNQAAARRSESVHCASIITYRPQRDKRPPASGQGVCTVA